MVPLDVIHSNILASLVLYSFYIQVAFTYLQNTSDDSPSASLSQARPSGVCSPAADSRREQGVGGEEKELVKEETLGDPVCPLPAESDRQMLPETRKRGSFCLRAVCICPSVSFQGFWFFQGALDKLQLILGRYEFQEPRVQNRCPSKLFKWSLLLTPLHCFLWMPLFLSFFFRKSTCLCYLSHIWTQGQFPSIIPPAFLACLEPKKFSSLDKLHVPEKADPLSHCPMYSNNRVDILLSLLQQISIISENIWLKNHYSNRSGGSVWSEEGQVFTLLPVKFCLKKGIRTASPIVIIRREDLELR